MAGSTVRTTGSPTVPFIGMLKYCSVTVRGENKEAVERIDTEHVALPRCEMKREGETERSSEGPTRHVFQPEKQ